MKKTMAALFGLFLAMMLLPSGVFAAVGTNLSISAGAGEVRPGETLTVTVQNREMTVAIFTGGFWFDLEMFEVTDIQTGDRVSLASTPEEANSGGTVGFAIMKASDTSYEAGTLLTVQLTAKKPGNAAFILYEDSDGADGFQSDDCGLVTVDVLGADGSGGSNSGGNQSGDNSNGGNPGGGNGAAGGQNAGNGNGTASGQNAGGGNTASGGQNGGGNTASGGQNGGGNTASGGQNAGGDSGTGQDVKNADQKGSASQSQTGSGINQSGNAVSNEAAAPVIWPYIAGGAFVLIAAAVVVVIVIRKKKQ